MVILFKRLSKRKMKINPFPKREKFLLSGKKSETAKKKLSFNVQLFSITLSKVRV